MSGGEGGGLMVSPGGLERVQGALRERGLDGWLLYEFRGQNWISARLLGVEGTTRRAFVLVPADGEPRALVHAIEHSHWRHWRWPLESYAGWREMEEKLADVAGSGARLAMEVSERDHVPTLDLVPSGTVELLREKGVEPVSSGDLVSLFHSVWSDEQRRGHEEAAEVVASVARDALERAAEAVRAGDPLTEGGLSEWIRAELPRRGVPVDVDTHVAVGAGAADPHYAPDGEGEVIGRGELLLVDLWGRTAGGGVFADQTWMGLLSDSVPARVREVWETVRDARDAAVDFLRRRHAAGDEVRGFEVDDVSRRVIRERGFGDYFIHRTGHSMDTRLHGSGPNLDNLETRDDRLLVPGVGFSVEPGVYVPGEIGVRSEINVWYGPEGPLVTPREPQTDLPVLL